MENLFTTKEFQEFIRAVNCMSEIEFYEMYRQVFGPTTAMSYVNEKLPICRMSFLNWICELDSETLDKFMSNYFDK